MNSWDTLELEDRATGLSGSDSGSDGSRDAPDWDSRLLEAVEAYLAALRAGESPDRAEFVGRYPEIASPLSECLAGLAFVQSAADQIRAEAAPVGGAYSRVACRLQDEPLASLGDYMILREVGRGGMGVVYEAQQKSLNRRVALKVLPLAAAFDPGRRQRFQIEAQAAAHLHHPHIVPVYAVGCEEGVHFYAMQFIEGRTLAEVIAEQGSGAGTHPGPDASTRPFPSLPESESAVLPKGEQGVGAAARDMGPRLPFSEVARIGLETAEALEHAHGLGVIHRDIKPANLMLDERAHLWVADFGLARFLGDAGLTGTDDVPGTLRYMSPEQAGGRRAIVDHRSDIYSLGATLYELLTLRPAHAAGDRSDLLRQILLEEPLAPRRLNRAIPRDLETIVLKAMSKSPDDRYATAAELASDLRLFLGDRPIRARRPRLYERVGHWTRRHRAIVATGLTGFLLCLLVSMLLLWQTSREALNQRRRERIALEQTFGLLNSIFHPAMGRMAAAGILKREDYQSAIAAYDKIAAMYDNVEGLREVAAHAFRRSGFYRMVLQDPRAHTNYDRAVATYQELGDRNPAYIWLRTHEIDTLREYASWMGASAGPARADRAIRRALEVGKLVAHDPRAAQPCFSVELGETLNVLAWELVCRPSRRAAMSAASAADLMEQVVIWHPNSRAYWNTLAVAQFRAGQHDAATRSLERAIALVPPDGDPADWYLMALIRHAAGDPAGATRWFDLAENRGRVPSPASMADVTMLRAEAASALGRVVVTTPPAAVAPEEATPKGPLVTGAPGR
jgi:serine/threonine protein kinase/tetratricopeptide (TPR) repeat protein